MYYIEILQSVEGPRNGIKIYNYLGRILTKQEAVNQQLNNVFNATPLSYRTINNLIAWNLRDLEGLSITELIHNYTYGNN